jgi:hypothetical protein
MKRAEALDLDLERLSTQLSKHVHAPRVQEDSISGVQSGVRSTPNFSINGSTPTAGDGDVPNFLVVSIVASVVLTVVLNLALRLFPTTRRPVSHNLKRSRSVVKPGRPQGQRAGTRVQVIFPWKLMLISSAVLTVLVNVLMVLLR